MIGFGVFCSFSSVA